MRKRLIPAMIIATAFAAFGVGLSTPPASATTTTISSVAKLPGEPAPLSAVASSLVAICHAVATDDGHHHHAGLCASKEGQEKEVKPGLHIVTCDYVCAGKGNKGRVRFSFKYLGTVGKNGYEPLSNPLADGSLQGATGAQFTYAGVNKSSKQCLASNPTDARGGLASIWPCDEKSFGKFNKWLIWELSPPHSPWKEYALINIYASNAGNDSKYYVLSGQDERDSEGTPVRVLSFGLVKREYQQWDAFPAPSPRVLSSRLDNSDRFMCHPNQVCTYTGEHLNGRAIRIPVSPGVGFDKQFILVQNSPHGYAGSVRNDAGQTTSNDLWIRRGRPGHYTYHCIKDGKWYATDHGWGYGEVLTAGQSHRCTEGHPVFRGSPELWVPQFNKNDASATGTVSVYQPGAPKAGAVHAIAPGVYGLGAAPGSYQLDSSRIPNRPTFYEVCHPNQHATAGVACLKNPGGNPNHVQDGVRLVQCAYHCAGNAASVIFEVYVTGVIGQNGYDPFSSPKDNTSYAGDPVYRFKYAPDRRQTRYCVSANPADVRTGHVMFWNCRNNPRRTNEDWVVHNVAGPHDPAKFALVNIGATNAAGDQASWVMSSTFDTGDHNPNVFTYTWGSTSTPAYQKWRGFPPVR